ncbi:MAG: hypothetical protein SVN78_09750 [Deferribacterota bacterium]|nr:hypothetical protein [Deferribacterota bacterium]
MFVKVCGITNDCDLLMAIKLGFSAVGFVRHRKSKRFIDENKLKNLLSIAEGKIKRVVVGISFDEVAPYITLADYVQVYEPINHKKVIYASDNFEFNVDCAYFLYDTSKGSGKTSEIPLKLRDISKKLIIAGGLNEENVIDVISDFSPFGVDVSSGVELEPGIKDHKKMENFIKKINKFCEEKNSEI